MATTSYSLEGRAQGGLFNADLLEKLNVFRIEMPALSARQDEFEDIVLGIKGEKALMVLGIELAGDDLGGEVADRCGHVPCGAERLGERAFP